MKVIGFVGSPRREGNTDILVQQVLEGARSCGAETGIFYLNEIPIRGCQGCNRCKTGDACQEDDGMNELYGEILAADGIVIGSPVYFGQITGQTKCFLDRWYAFVNTDRSIRISGRKRIGLVYPQWEPDPRKYDSLATQFIEFMRFFGLDVVDAIAGPGLQKRGDAKRREVLLEKAYRLGMKLAEQG